MDFMSEKNINNVLEQLLGQKVIAIKRLSDVMRIEIGNTIEEGTAMNESTFILEVQSAWRIIDSLKKEVLLASSDVFSPNSSLVKKEDFDWNTFEWDIPGNSLFDEKSQIWLNEVPIYIREYKINVWRDLRLIFSNNSYLEVLIDTSDYVKCWILSKFREKEDLVITGLGYEFENKI